MKQIIRNLALAICAAIAFAGSAQTAGGSILTVDPVTPDSVEYVSLSDSLLMAHANDIDIFSQPLELPDAFFAPAVYDSYYFIKPMSVSDTPAKEEEWERWISDYKRLSDQMRQMKQNLFFQHPELVRYNLASLPEPPAPYITVIDPSNFTISVREDIVPAAVPTVEAEAVKKRHWIRNFSASLQFSQAYVSPNWYQGGNNNLNALAAIIYNVKLNDAYHPNLLFETNFQYKLGMNSAPEDSLHAYNISEDVFQINSTFGIKAAKHWYYSLTGMFKTQLLNSYTVNTNNLASSFLSPGELTAGLGMTYSYENPKKTFSITTSIAPVSYHLITCINSKMDPTVYGIPEGKKCQNQFGSSVDVALKWQIAHNIALTSHLFSFTDYKSIQADWENTLAFAINSFLTTQIYVHLRYDSQTPPVPDSHWKKLQVKEIFSIGFAYKFSSI